MRKCPRRCSLSQRVPDPLGPVPFNLTRNGAAASQTWVPPPRRASSLVPPHAGYIVASSCFIWVISDCWAFTMSWPSLTASGNFPALISCCAMSMAPS